MKVLTICNNCGKQVWDYESANRQFCCKECAYIYFRKEADERKLRKCRNCKREFSPKEPRAKFCCRECCIEYGKKNGYSCNLRKCEWCGKEFYPKKRDQRYCSKKCGYSWYSKYKQSDEQKQLQIDKVLNLISTGRVKKSFTKPHVIIDNLLDTRNIKHIDEYNIKYYLIDIYLPSEELMIEIMGDYWHTNPTTKHNNAKSIAQQKTIHRDKRKHTYVNNKYNIEILYLWETDIYKNIDLCEKLICAYIDNNGVLEDYNSFNYEVKNEELMLKENIVEPMFLCG